MDTPCEHEYLMMYKKIHGDVKSYEYKININQ